MGIQDVNMDFDSRFAFWFWAMDDGMTHHLQCTSNRNFPFRGVSSVRWDFPN